MAWNVSPNAPIWTAGNAEFTWVYEPPGFFPMARMALVYRRPGGEWTAAFQTAYGDAEIAQMKSSFPAFMVNLLQAANAGLRQVFGTVTPPPAGTPQDTLELVSWLWLNSEVVQGTDGVPLARQK